MIKRTRFLTALICIILSIACAFGMIFTGCGEYKPPENQGDTPVTPDYPENPDDPENPEEVVSTDFSVQLVVKNKKTWQNFTYDFYDASDNKNGVHSQDWIKWESIRIQWTNVETGARHFGTLNNDGKATCAGLDGDYKVTIFNVPTGFTYEPNINYADNLTKNIEVVIYKIQSKGVKVKLLAQDKDGNKRSVTATRLPSTGVFRTTLASKDDRAMFYFQPSKQGTYSMTTLVDITENKINPKLSLFLGQVSSGAIYFNKEQDGGGSENTHTKNVNLEYNISADMVGNALFFELYSTSLDGNSSYPLTVDFLLQREGDFTRTEYDTTPVPVTEDFEKTPPTPEGTATNAFDSPNTGSGWCDSTAVILNSESGIADFRTQHNKYGSKFIRREELTDQIILNTAEGIAEFKANYKQNYAKDGDDVTVITANVPSNDGYYYYYSYSSADLDLKNEFNQVIGKAKNHIFTLTNKYSFDMIINSQEGIAQFLTKANNTDAKVVRKEIVDNQVVHNTAEGIAQFIQQVGGNATVSNGTVPKNDGNYYYVEEDTVTSTYTMTEKFELYDGEKHFITYNAVTDTYTIGINYYSTDGYYYFYDYDEATNTYILTDRLYAVIDAKANSIIDLTDTHINYRFLNGKNYLEFITTYRQYSNFDGSYPVNEELAELLQNYCISANMFNDGYGFAETAGYNADEKGMWMIACKYYKK